MDYTPPVSVLMPVYNGERYLREAIDSILVQAFTDFELLIIDNGSTDASRAIIGSYADPRVRLLVERRRGIVQSLNLGLAEARGYYIARMDADDVAHPERLAKQMAHMRSHPDTVLVGSWALIIDASGKHTGGCIRPPTHGRAIYVALYARNVMIHGSVVMRKDTALAVGGYRAEFVTAEDYDLWLRLGEMGELANLDEPLYTLRLHNRSKTASEGRRVVQRYTARSQQLALQRRLSGHDDLGYSMPCSVQNQVSIHQHQDHSMGLRTVALSDLAQICLWRGDIHMALRLLRRALSQPRGSLAWSFVPPSSKKMAYLRDVLRAVRCGDGLELSRAKVERIVTRVTERLNA